MAPGLLLENVAPLGYLLVSRVLAEVPGTELLYYGVDRLPAFCPTYGPIREFFGEPPEQDPIVAAAIDEWHAIADEPYFTRITPDYEQALRLMSILGQRAPLEMVFCELAWGPGEEKWLSRFRPFFGQPQNATLFYGYDVAWRECTESAITEWACAAEQKGIWAGRLNRWGLLNTYADALELWRAVTRPDLAEEFQIFRVHRVGP